jgi:hypothetical protein
MGFKPALHLTSWNNSLIGVGAPKSFTSFEELLKFVDEAKKREEEGNWNEDPSFQSFLSVRCLLQTQKGDERKEEGEEGSLLWKLPKELWLFHVFSRLEPEDLLSLSSVNTTLRAWIFYLSNSTSTPLNQNLWVSSVPFIFPPLLLLLLLLFLFLS